MKTLVLTLRLVAIIAAIGLLAACGGSGQQNQEKSNDTLANADSVPHDTIPHDTLGGNECLTIANHCNAACSTDIVNAHVISEAVFNSMLVPGATANNFTKTYINGLLANLSCSENDYIDIVENSRSTTVTLTAVQYNNPNQYPTNNSMLSPPFLNGLWSIYPTADGIEIYKGATVPAAITTSIFKLKAGTTTLGYFDMTQTYP